MAWTEQVCRTDLGPVCFNNGNWNSGACNLFDEMPTSNWRSPSRVLEVTVRRAYYPITEEVLHLVFGPFGLVEQVNVIAVSDHVLACVVFQSKQAAAKAFGNLHGFCQLDIK
ncbi:uncharacterized protein C2845_PM11G19060 [Panicum miliaceum]|uniref:PTBP1-like RNA recognition motif 2 domain-containing protein n=1 Tax=Panicum miliaceum TaxID=4540 RepID=A0A3L6RMM4_PANMI|nr:uncharacterized protein C2845_PM11G19060 [Panicum miliaceum]